MEKRYRNKIIIVIIIRRRKEGEKRTRHPKADGRLTDVTAACSRWRK